MTPTPFLTIGIPTRNRLDPLLKLLRSVLDERYPHFEVIIGDDGERYDLPAEIRRAYPDLPFRCIHGPRITAPANRQNILEHARSELIVMIDDDHVLSPGTLQQLVETILSAGDIGIVSAIWPHVDEPPVTIEYDEMKDLDEYRLDLDNISRDGDFWWKNGCEMFKSFQRNPRVFESQLAGGGCIILRKSIIEAVGGYPLDYSVVSFRDDTDISHRVYLAGYRVLLDTRAIASHLHAAEGGSRDTNAWARNFVSDGLKFLEKLEVWRETRRQLDFIAEHHGPIRAVYVASPRKPELNVLFRGIADEHLPGLVLAVRDTPDGAADFVLLEDSVAGASVPVPKEKLVIVPQDWRRLAVDISEGAVVPMTGEFSAFVAPGSPPDLLDEARRACTALGVRLSEREDNSGEAHGLVFIDLRRERSPGGDLLRALASGHPVLSLAGPARSEIVIDGYNGITAAPGGILAALDLLKRADRIALSKNARVSVTLGWSFRERAEEIRAKLAEMLRARMFGDLAPNPVSDARIDQIVRDRMSEEGAKRSLEEFVLRREGSTTFLRPELLPRFSEQVPMQRTAFVLAQLPKFSFHYGGVREALELFDALNGTVLSITPEPETMQALFCMIGGIDAYIVEVPKAAFGKQFARDLPPALPNYRSVRVPAPGAAAAWAMRFRRTEGRAVSVVVVEDGGVLPGSITEPYVTLDREVFSREALEAIASSEVVVGPESWQTVFAELAGVRVVRSLGEFRTVVDNPRRK